MGEFTEDNPPRDISIANIDEGSKFVSSIREASIADGGSVDIWMEDPSGSTEESFIAVTWSPGAAAEARVSDSVSEDGAGSEPDILNSKLAATNTPSNNLVTGAGYTINGGTVSFNIPGGTITGGAAGGGSANTVGPSTFLLEPGNTVLFQLFNRSGGNANMGISVTWFEVNL